MSQCDNLVKETNSNPYYPGDINTKTMEYYGKGPFLNENIYGEWYSNDIEPESIVWDSPHFYIVENKKSKKILFDDRVLVKCGEKYFNKSNKVEIEEALKHGKFIKEDRGFIYVDVKEEYYTWYTCKNVSRWVAVKL